MRNDSGRIAWSVATWLIPALLALTVFANSAGNGFVRDDVRTVEQNEYARKLAEPLVVFGPDPWTTGEARLYRPLTLLSYAVDHAVCGATPRGYHLTNIGLHALVSVLVAQLVLTLSRSRWIACFAAVLFAVHPLHAEAVANISGRPDLLVTAALLLAILAHRHGGGCARGRRWLYGVVTSLLFAAALLIKESAITFLALPILHDLCWPLDRSRAVADIRRRVPEYVALAVVAIAYLGLRQAVLGGLAREVIPYQANPLAHVGLDERLMSAVAIVARYAWLFIYPDRLVCDYSYAAVAPTTSPGDPLFLVGSVLIVASVVLAWWSWRRLPLVSFAIGLVGATYSLVSNVFLPIGTVMGERLLYLPSVGLCAVAAVAGTAAVEKLCAPEWRRWAIPALVAVIALPLAMRAVDRSRDWRSDRDLYVQDVIASPRSASLQYNAGSMWLDTDEVDVAVRHLEESMAIYPTPQAAFTLGRAYGANGDRERKLHWYRKTVDQFPGTYWAHFAAAWLAVADRQYAQAREQFQTAVDLRPEDGTARYNLGLLQLQLGRAQDAVVELQRAKGLSRRSDAIRIESLGDAYLVLGMKERAAAVWRQGVESYPQVSSMVEKLVRFEKELNSPTTPSP